MPIRVPVVPGFDNFLLCNQLNYNDIVFKSLAGLAVLAFAMVTNQQSFAQQLNRQKNELANIKSMPEINSETKKPDQSSRPLDIIIVTGSKQITDISGAVSYISPEQLSVYNYTDIKRVLRSVPGVNLQEEDGYGLFPNIGIRGSGTDKSSKILLLEDGVPIAPAPFSAPSAYYFPSMGRINAVEVTKSVGTVKYGPITTAGSIQLFSTPIPKTGSASGKIMASSLGGASVHFWAGNRIKTESLPFNVGFLLETWQDRTDGFKQIDIGNTGYYLSDYVGKLGFYSKDGARFVQSLELKLQSSNGKADETYLGLSQQDFDTRPLMRYRASQLDNIKTDHKTYQLTHNIKFSEKLQFTNMVYRTEFARNWQKLDRFDNSALSGLSECNSLNEILNDTQLCALEYQVLLGPDNYTSPDNVLGIRENNRSYFARGLQSALGVNFDTGGFAHNLIFSVRYHEDGVDRFQQQDQYRIENGFIVKTEDNPPGSQSNRLSDANSFAIYIEDTISAGDWKINAGLRYEKINTKQLRWSTPDRGQIPASIRENSFDIWLPSFGVVYEINNDLSLLAGITRGFAPPGPSSQNAAPERSVIYEYGGRYNGEILSLELIGFYNDYSNLLAECTNSSGGSECEIGDADNAGAANVYGLEISAGMDLDFDVVSIPLTLIYAYTDTKLLSTVDSDIYGNVSVGDEIPYVPRHQLTFAAGMVFDNWGVNANLNYISPSRNEPGQGSIEASDKIDARTIVDLAAFYQLKDGIKLHLRADNLFDNIYLAGRRPYGLRPGKPREIKAGVSFDF